MATDFAVCLRRFLTSCLAGLRGCSPSTIAWFRDERSVPPGKLTLGHIDAGAVAAFLGHLQEDRHNSVPARNQRLAAISSFCTWMQTGDPARMACWQDIIAIGRCAKGENQNPARPPGRLVIEWTAQLQTPAETRSASNSRSGPPHQARAGKPSQGAPARPASEEPHHRPLVAHPPAPAHAPARRSWWLIQRHAGQRARFGRSSWP